MYTLTYAAGRLPDPGSGLPYEYDPSRYVTGGEFLGHPLAGSFDYLVDIDYNHPAGTPPSDRTRPLGEAAGRLDRHPVVVMGGPASPAR